MQGDILVGATMISQLSLVIKAHNSLCADFCAYCICFIVIYFFILLSHHLEHGIGQLK